MKIEEYEYNLFKRELHRLEEEADQIKDDCCPIRHMIVIDIQHLKQVIYK